MGDVLKNSFNEDKNVNYVYAIFITPNGKGYGCFAIKKTSNHNTFLVGASFCHPSDRNKFRKRIARNMASGRANNIVSFDKELKLGSIAIIDNMLSNKKLLMPSWASRAYNVGSFSYQLKDDEYSSISLLQKLFKQDNNKQDGNDVAEKFILWASNV